MTFAAPYRQLRRSYISEIFSKGLKTAFSTLICHSILIVMVPCEWLLILFSLSNMLGIWNEFKCDVKICLQNYNLTGILLIFYLPSVLGYAINIEKGHFTWDRRTPRNTLNRYGVYISTKNLDACNIYNYLSIW